MTIDLDNAFKHHEFIYCTDEKPPTPPRENCATVKRQNDRTQRKVNGINFMLM